MQIEIILSILDCWRLAAAAWVLDKCGQSLQLVTKISLLHYVYGMAKGCSAFGIFW